MELDHLQWLWNGVDDFQIKFNDLRERAVRNFQRPFDVAQHDVNCRVNNPQTRMPISCCKGLTFKEARFVKEKLTGARAKPNPKDREFKPVPAATCWGIKNCKNCLVLAMTRKLFLLHLKQELVKTKTIFFLEAGELYRWRSTTGEICSMTPSSSSRVCALSSSDRAPRHRKRSARRRRLKANASTQNWSLELVPAHPAVADLQTYHNQLVRWSWSSECLKEKWCNSQYLELKINKKKASRPEGDLLRFLDCSPHAAVAGRLAS